MTDRKLAKEVYTQLCGDKEILALDPELKEIMISYIYGDVYHHGSLDTAMKELILVVVNTTNHTLVALKRHVEAALQTGVTPIVIKEAIYQCTPYVGLGKVEEALDVVNTILTKQGVHLPLDFQSTVTEDTRFQKGFAVQCQAFGKEAIQANHDQAPEELKHIQTYLSAYCFGDFYTRNGLDLKTRELLTFVMLATLGGCENQLRAHVNANVTVKNTRNVLLETITVCQPYIGFPRTLNAITIINEVTSDKGE